jgi:hypothetical protein
MGTLRSMTDHIGLMVNGITLGEPARDVDDNDEPVDEYRWDDSRLPSGVISDDGEITVDEVDE